jgi:hypothetical protein
MHSQLEKSNTVLHISLTVMWWEVTDRIWRQKSLKWLHFIIENTTFILPSYCIVGSIVSWYLHTRGFLVHDVIPGRLFLEHKHWSHVACQETLTLKMAKFMVSTEYFYKISTKWLILIKPLIPSFQKLPKNYYWPQVSMFTYCRLITCIP